MTPSTDASFLIPFSGEQCVSLVFFKPFFVLGCCGWSCCPLAAGSAVTQHQIWLWFSAPLCSHESSQGWDLVWQIKVKLRWEGSRRTPGHHGNGNWWSHSWAPSLGLAQVRDLSGSFSSLRALPVQFKHFNFDQNFYQVFCLNACQIQSSLPPSVLQAVFLPEAQLGGYELLGSCHLMVTGCWREITLIQSIFSRWVFIYNEKLLCQY